MKLDKQAVERLLALNDAQLQAVITQLAQENGIDAAVLSGLRMSASDMANVRRALAMATDEDIKAAAERLGRKPSGDR